MTAKKALAIVCVLFAFLLFSTTACSGEEKAVVQQTVVSTPALVSQPKLTPTEAAQVATQTPVSPTPCPNVVAPPEPSEPAPTPPPPPAQKEVYVTATDGLRVRTGPGLSYEKIKTMPLNSAGSILEGPATADGYIWWKVRYEDGTEGWCADDWLAFGTPPVVPTEPPVQHVCDFTKPVTLRPATTYDIFGTDEYDTLVCGYVELVYYEQGGESGVPLTVPYFVIVDYADPGFIQAVDEGIRIGNSVNERGTPYYRFSLGCYDDGKILGGEYSDSNPYIDEVTGAAILNSSPDNLVSLVLSFGYHGGRGCDCCNLAHRVRLY